MNAPAWFRDSVTDHDGQYDTGRLLMFLGGIAAVGLQVYVVVWQGKAFDVLSFCSGIGALAGGGGLYLMGDGAARRSSAEARSVEARFSISDR